ncbi:sulfotransferase [Thioploca ingrica]|uniref:Sulfotransferase n=1 Tax=Thioploca ingrica TaxID=40754 RepID=A0A090BV02_9GAMM|nr:sulfotransferase [Thioploca ingrica]
MMQKIKRIIKILIGYEFGRAVTIFPDDILIVSYPKSGNTWTRFLIANLLFPQEPITFANIEDKIPDIYQSKERELLHIPRPRILKSHEYFDPRYQRIIYIVRDPRDIAISLYYYNIKFGVFNDNYSIDSFIIEHFTKKMNINNFGTWGEDVGSWLGAKKDDSNFLLLRYEDMLSDPKIELKKIAHHLKISVTDELIDKVIKQSSFEHMQLLENNQSNLWKLTKNTRKDKFFVRSGQSGQWQNKLSTHSIKTIESTWSQIMMQLGYL